MSVQHRRRRWWLAIAVRQTISSNMAYALILTNAVIQEEMALKMTSEREDPITIPYQTLSNDALRGVVEAFVLREGTDYGAHEFTLLEKAAHVMQQLARGEAEVVFDPDSGSVDIVRVKMQRGRSAKGLPDR